MTATLDNMATRTKDKPGPAAEQKLAENWWPGPGSRGVAVTGPEGLLKQLTNWPTAL